MKRCVCILVCVSFSNDGVNTVRCCKSIFDVDATVVRSATDTACACVKRWYGYYFRAAKMVLDVAALLCLESALDGRLHLLDVVGLDAENLAAECLFDAVHELPRRAIVDKVDGHSLATESTRAACKDEEKNTCGSALLLLITTLLPAHLDSPILCRYVSASG